MKKVLLIIFWVLFAVGLILIVFFANTENNNDVAKKPDISIHVEGENTFLTESELLDRLIYKRLYQKNMKVNLVNIKKIEAAIIKMEEVKKVRVYKNIGESWNIDVELRNPIARILRFLKKHIT